MPRKPSNFGSKSQAGSLNGAERRTGAIGSIFGSVAVFGWRAQCDPDRRVGTGYRPAGDVGMAPPGGYAWWTPPHEEGGLQALRLQCTPLPEPRKGAALPSPS